MNKFKTTVAAGLIAVALAGAVMPTMAYAYAPNPGLAGRVASQIEDARAILLRDCKVDIFDADKPMGDVVCDGIRLTTGEAWNNALNKAGLPQAIRESIANNLKLDRTDTITIMGRANPEAVKLLMTHLREMAKGA